MHNFLVMTSYFFLLLILITLVFLSYINTKIEVFKKTVIKRNILSFSTAEANEYIPILRKSNRFILFSLISCILSIFFITENNIPFSILFIILGIIFCLVALQKWRYFKKTILSGYLIITKKKNHFTYFFTNLEEKQKVLSWQSKMIYSVYLIFIFGSLSLFIGLMTKL